MGEAVQEKLPIENPESLGARRPFSVALLAAIGVSALALIAAFLWTGRSSPSSSSELAAHMPFGASEQAYAGKLTIENIALSQATNFLNQEVTIVAADLVNGGDRAIGNAEVSVEFLDELNQVILREIRPAFPSREPPLTPGERRKFEISIEHIPPSWNMQQPALRIVGLQFPPAS